MTMNELVRRLNVTAKFRLAAALGILSLVLGALIWTAAPTHAETTAEPPATPRFVNQLTDDCPNLPPYAMSESRPGS